MEIRKVVCAMLLCLILPSLGNAEEEIQTLRQLQEYQQRRLQTIQFRLYQSDHEGGVINWNPAHTFSARRGTSEITMSNIRVGFYQMHTTGRDRNDVVILGAENHIWVGTDITGPTEVRVLLEVVNMLPVDIVIILPVGNYTEGGRYDYIVRNESFGAAAPTMIFRGGNLYTKLYAYGPNFGGTVVIGVTDDDNLQRAFNYEVSVREVAIGEVDETDHPDSGNEIETGSLVVDVGFMDADSTDAEATRESCQPTPWDLNGSTIICGANPTGTVPSNPMGMPIR